jgi:hypothetical protein
LSPAMGDFNADGRLDLLVASPESWRGERGEVKVLMGNGDGTFQDGVPHEAGRNPNSGAVGDFNGDGQDDIAVVSYATFPSDDGSVAVLLGNGDGTFQEMVRYSIGRQSKAVAAGDFNRDCIPDLAAPFQRGAGDYLVAIFLGRGDGSFRDGGSYPTGRGQLEAVVAGDFNGDGFLDLTTANNSSGDVGILLNAADWVHHRNALCDVPRGPAPGPGAPSSLWPAIAASLIAPAKPSAVPIHTSVLFPDAGFTGTIFWSTDLTATTPDYYQFQHCDRGIAYFPGGVIFRTARAQELYVFDWPGIPVFGYAAFDVQP